MSLLEAVGVGVATYYVALAITRTHGLFGMFEWARLHLPHGGLLECHVCLSLWLAIVFYVLMMVAPPVVWIVAAAGLSVWFDRLSD